MISYVVKKMSAMKVMNADPKESATLVAPITLVREISAMRGTIWTMLMGYVTCMAI
jgi:hypothetical protein